MQSNLQAPRLNAYRGPKRQLLGNQAGQAAPAWRVNQANARKAASSSQAQAEQGSKILLSRLPVDVNQEEVEALFLKTVGPLKEAFLVYNSQGKSKGMAIVWFQHPEHAALARAKYHGKIVDGRRPIKIEIIKDEADTPKAPPQPAIPSLLDRIAGPSTVPIPTPPRAAKLSFPAVANTQAVPRPAAAQNRVAPAARPIVARRNLRHKKGPRRLKKKPLTVADLDKEMEDYRAQADDPAFPA